MWWLNWWSSFARDALILVVRHPKLDRLPAPVAGDAPLADAHAEVRLHVERVRDARRRLDVVLRERPPERRAADVLEEVDELVVRPRVQRVDPQERLVEDRGGVRTVLTRQLGAPEPTFLVVLVQREQFVE